MFEQSRFSNQNYSSFTSNQSQNNDISHTNPFFNDQKIMSILDSYKKSHTESDARTREQSYSSQGGIQKSPNYTFYYQGVSSPPFESNNSKFSDILSERSFSIGSKIEVSQFDTYNNYSQAKDIKTQPLDFNSQTYMNKSCPKQTQFNNVYTPNVVQSEIQNQQQQKIDNYEKTIFLLNKKVNELESQLQQKNDELINLKINQDISKKALIDNKIQQLNEQFFKEKALLLKENSELKSQVETLKNNNASQLRISQAFQQLQEENNNLTSQLEQLTQSFIEVENLHNEAANRESEIKVCEKYDYDDFELAAIEIDNKKLKETIEMKDKEIEELQRSLTYVHSQLHDEVDKMRNQEFSPEPEYQDQLERKVIEQAEKINEYEEKIQALSSTIILLDQKNQELEDKIQQNSKELEQIIETNKEIKEDNLALKIAVSFKERECDEIQQSLTQIQQDHQLQQQLLQKRAFMTSSLNISKIDTEF